MNYFNYLISSIIILLIFILYFDAFNAHMKCKQAFAKIVLKYNLHILFNKKDISNPSNNDLLTIINSQVELPKVDNYDIIPNNLFQIYMFYKAPIPQYIFDGINKYAHNYNHVIFDEYQANQFLTQYFNKQIIQRFNDLKSGAHKADLLRYCYLYIYGGVYIDIKTILIKQLDDIFINKTYFYTCLESLSGVMYNGILASKARNPFFLKLIWYIINIPLYIINAPFRIYYITFCQDLYLKIQKDLLKDSKLESGLNIGISQNYYLFQDISYFNKSKECTKFDRYGVCNMIYDINNKIFIGRDPNFPWS